MTSGSRLPDLESGELVRGRISERVSDGYLVKLSDHEGFLGIYATPLDIAGDTRVELCFVGFDNNRALLAAKSRLSNREQLQDFASSGKDGRDDFSPRGHLALPNRGSGAIDFNPPSEFSRALIELLAHWKLISKEQQLRLREELSRGKWEVVGLLKRLDVLTPGELVAVDRGRDLIDREKISWTDFQRAFYQELANGINFEDCPSIKGRITS